MGGLILTDLGEAGLKVKCEMSRRFELADHIEAKLRW